MRTSCHTPQMYTVYKKLHKTLAHTAYRPHLPHYTSHLPRITQTTPTTHTHTEGISRNRHTHLERFLPGVHQLMSLEFGALHKSLAALCTDMHPRTVSVQMFAHGSIVPEHLATTLHMKIANSLSLPRDHCTLREFIIDYYSTPV